MKTVIIYLNNQFFKKQLLLFLRKESIRFHFSFGLVIWLSMGAMFSPQAYANISQSYDLFKTSSNNSCFFQLNTFTTFKITENSGVLLNANLIINSNIEGKGNLTLSSQERIFIDANNKEINNLVIRCKTKVRLIGHLHIMRGICIQDKGEIALGDFNLILLPSTQVDILSGGQIVESGMGYVINSNQGNDCFSSFLYYLKIQSAIGVLTTNNSSLQQISSSYGTFVKRWMLSDFYLEMDTPPPILA